MRTHTRTHTRAHTSSSQPLQELSQEAQRCRNRLPADPVVMYEKLRAQGLQYGPAFRTIECAHYNEAALGIEG